MLCLESSFLFIFNAADIKSPVCGDGDLQEDGVFIVKQHFNSTIGDPLHK